MEAIKMIGKKAKEVSFALSKMSSVKKNEALMVIADALDCAKETIKEANEKDVNKARENGVKESLVDRLVLTDDRIKSMTDGLRNVTSLDDPIGEVLGMRLRPNGLKIGQVRVPIGVIGIIYESRPNVTVDAFGLCFKTGNVVILKGGSDAIESNIAIVDVIQSALESIGIPKEVVQLIKDTKRETAMELMKMNEYLDLLIPRGGAGLIQAVIKNSTVPVIETGVGNCHIYVDESADIEMAKNIIINAKTQRTGVCNAAESLVIHKNIADKCLHYICNELIALNVQVRGDEQALELVPYIEPADDQDWGMEYLDSIISVKIVDNIDDAINHINKYNTKHSEAIITDNYENAERFLNEIDAAAVYVNASTRFTDGSEFGFGAEIGISTQKLHARGPMGLKELTTTKYIIYGNGQVR